MVNPQLAIAQGTELTNFPLFYPRPTPGIRRILKRLGTSFLVTGEVGAVQVISNGKQIKWRSVKSEPVVVKPDS